MLNHNLIELKSVSKEYTLNNQIYTILSDINLSIVEKDFVAILGSSGCGKSTLLNILAKIDKPTQGEVNFNSKLYLKDIYNFGLVHQKPIFVKELNIKENILLPTVYNKFINKKEAIEKAHFLAKQFNLSHILKQKVMSLSGGEKQRVSIIRALIEEPKILFLDEPTGALDEDNSSILIELLNQLKEELNLTIVMVTHNHNTLIHCNKKYTIKHKTLINLE